jgi:hypothetical protein
MDGKDEAEERKSAEGGRPIALVDGSNVAHSTEGGGPRLENIVLICRKLDEEGYAPIVVTDAALRHQIDDRDGFERRVGEGRIKQAPAGTDADYFILAFARELEAAIVSNDRFRDRADAFPEARDRIIRYMIVADEVVFERRNKPRRG